MIGASDRLRWLRPGGGLYPWHYILGILGPAGARIVAAGRGQRAPRPVELQARREALATSGRLHHLLGPSSSRT